MKVIRAEACFALVTSSSARRTIVGSASAASPPDAVSTAGSAINVSSAVTSAPCSCCTLAVIRSSSTCPVVSAIKVSSAPTTPRPPAR